MSCHPFNAIFTILQTHFSLFRLNHKKLILTNQNLTTDKPRIKVLQRFQGERSRTEYLPFNIYTMNPKSSIYGIISLATSIIVFCPLSAFAQNLYTTDSNSSGQSIIDKIQSDGTVTTYATAPINKSFSGGLVFDSSGNLYTTSSNSSGQSIIDKIQSDGTVTTYATAPAGNRGFVGLASDSSGNLYTTDSNSSGQSIIDKIQSDGTVTTYATFAPIPVGNNPSFRGSGFTGGLAFDSIGNLYATDVGGAPIGRAIIDKISPNGIVTIAAINRPNYLTFDGLVGGLFSTSYSFSLGRSIIVRIPSNGFVETYATPPPGNSFSNGLALDSSGNLYTTGFNSSGQSIVDKIQSDGTVTTYATAPAGNRGFVGLASDSTASTPVPEPFTIVGTLIGGIAAFRMRQKLKAIKD
jgi:hypothetical protein